MAIETVKLVDVELQWACLSHTNDLSGKYQVDLVNLSEENQNKLLGLGPLRLRTRDDKPEKGTFVTAKSMHPILTVDSKGAPVTAKVSNGSRGNIVCSVFPFKRKSPDGSTHGLSIAKLVVTELKEFEPAGVDDGEL